MNAAIDVLAALLGNAPVLADSPFSGAWLMDIGPADSDPQLLSLRNGLFSRGIDKPDFTVKADGAFHRFPSGDYVDAIAVAAVSPYKVIERDF